MVLFIKFNNCNLRRYPWIILRTYPLLYFFYYFSLKNSLSQEESLKHQFNTTLNDFEKRLQEKERELSLAQTSYDEMVEKLSASTREKNSLVKQLEDTRERLNDEQKRAERYL